MSDFDQNPISDAELEALFGDPAPAKPPASDAVFRTPSGRDLSVYRATSFITDRERTTPWIEAVYTSAMEALRRKNYAETLRHLRRCLEDNPNFIDALLWLGRLEDEPDVRRSYLQRVLSLQMSNAEAMRELMILDGDIEADPTFDSFTMPEVRRAEGAVGVQARNVRCPRCGSPNLSSDDDSPNLLTCTSCGHTIEKNAQSGGVRLLTRELIQRRSQEVLWVVGKRTLKCHGCGAERTLPQQQMAAECPFCGSRQVVEQDALGTLSQPEVLVPFRVSQQQALSQLRDALGGGLEKLKGFFVENRAKRVELSGVFLPFWVFDVMAEVTHTYEVVQRRDSGGFGQTNPQRYTETFGDAALNLPIAAFTQPPAALVRRVQRYDLSLAVEYRPEYIAQHSAELYTIDFDKASMDARSTLSETMRGKHHRDDDRYRTVSISCLMNQASFRLVLVPMWAATVFEKDGDVRPALVNGQTGAVALGRASKPR
jgi:DNA-directed RNA polymerase subunit RPC12/RpoP